MEVEFGHPNHDIAIDTIDAYLFSGEVMPDEVIKLEEIFARWGKSLVEWKEIHEERAKEDAENETS